MTSRRVLPLVLLLAATIVCAAQQPTPSISPEEARHRVDAGVKALQQWYQPGWGLYKTTGWWNAANAMTAITDAMRITGSKQYVGVLANTFKEAQKTIPTEQRTDPKKELTGFPGFLNKYYDDEGWWALAWIDAYDLTKNPHYLTMAQSIFEDMAGGWDETCGGGIWWSKDRNYKNAIANELFFSVAAHLATRIYDAQGQRYADWAKKEWQWFRTTGMINSDHLVNDGLAIDAAKKTCHNNQKTIWTYNQGVLIGALTEWSRTGGDATMLTWARQIGDASVAHFTGKDGILHEPCEPNCGADGVQFKGILLRNLRDLNEVAPDPLYAKAFAVNSESIWTKSRTAQNTFGVVWSGPPGQPDAATQSSALDALIAAAATAR